MWTLGPYGRRLSVAGIHARIVGQPEKLGADAVDDLDEASIRAIGVPRPAWKERIARNQDAIGQKAQAARGVSGGVKGF
jgi:hypothetical protein